LEAGCLVKVNARTITTETYAGDDPRAVVVTLVLYGDEADDLVAAYRPGQSPEMLADPARVVAVPVAAAVAELVRP
jgi:hypothetical protein